MKFRGAVFFFMFALLELTAVAQQTGGVITGRVITEDGLPIPHALVSIFGVSGRVKQTTARRETAADDEGNFVADGLEAIPYLVSAWAPGYVPASYSAVHNPLVSEARFVRAGESATVTLIRGGVITGRVTNDAGEPIIGAPVKATRVTDDGRSTISDVGYAPLLIRTTDDRGIYRIYGLAPGSYIVAAGGSDSPSARATPFAGRTITYHPSSTRDAASLVSVSSGVEATSIDIRYRGESGFAISGKVLGGPGTSGMAQTTTNVYLRSPTTAETIDTQTLIHQNGYAFYGVPNGEYEVIASNDGMLGENGLASRVRRVTVKSADVTGVDLTLLRNASISGMVVVVKPDPEVLKCKKPPESNSKEMIVRARRDDPAEKRGPLLQVLLGYGVGIPSDKGVFTIGNLNPGRHRIELELPDETWYLKAMGMSGSKPAIDPRAGLTVKSGDELNGLTLTIASGAATLKGKVPLAKDTKLPSRLHVHLIPAEAEAIDDVLRFAETSTKADGSFTFTHLSPGKYLVLAREISDSGDKSPRAWEPAERKKLRKEADAANLAIELKPCQSITDYDLLLTK